MTVPPIESQRPRLRALRDSVRRFDPSWTVAAFIALAVVAVVVLVALKAPPTARTLGLPTVQPVDMERLGVTLAHPDATPRRSPLEVIDAARAEAPGLVDIPGGEATLYLTVSSDGRLTWIVRISGFEFEEPGPPDEKGNPAPGRLIHYGYVFVSDVTGAVEAIQLRT